MLVYDEKVSRHFWRIAIATGILPSRDSEIRRAIMRITKTKTILKCPVNKLFSIKNMYQGNNQTGKAREQNWRWEAAVIGELEKIWMLTAWTLGGGVFQHYKYQFLKWI